MKSILLTSTALVAFAGAASAGGHASPISFAGEATLGYNDEAQGGFYWDSSLDVTGTAGLDNGLTATASFGLDIADGNLGGDVMASDFTVTIAGGGASLTFGDTDPVAEANFADVSGMQAVSFNDQDRHFDVAGFEAMLVGSATVAGFTAQISYGVDNGAGNDLTGEQIDAMQIHVNGALSGFTIDFAYQEEFGPTPTIFGISGSTSLGGADITIAYADRDAGIDGPAITSTGISVSYPVGPVTVGGYYTMNDGGTDEFGVSADYVNGPISVSAAYDDDGTDGGDSFSVEGSYDVGNGLTVLAGLVDSGDAYYVAGELDLGSGATLLVSYADDDNNGANDEIGDPEYNAGATVEVSFSF